MSQHCCGSPVQVFRLSEGADDDAVTGPRPIELHRCGACGSRAYHHGGEVLTPDDAFAALAGTFRRGDRPVHRGQHAGVQRAERIAAKVAAGGVDARVRNSPPAAAPKPGPGSVDVTDLADLLAGWTVLGVAR